MSLSRIWAVGGIFALVFFAVPFTLLGAIASTEPEIRLVKTDTNISALIVDGTDRVLVIHAIERGTARGVAGKLARPWETPYQTIIAPPDDAAAVGLLEAMRQPSIGQIVVAGLPGSAYAWSAVERDARDAGIKLTFAGVTNRVELDRLSIDIVPGSDETGAFLRIERDAAVIVIMLGAGKTDVAAHATIGSSQSSDSDSGIAVSLASGARSEPTNALLIRSNETVRITMESSTIRFAGGKFYPSRDVD